MEPFGQFICIFDYSASLEFVKIWNDNLVRHAVYFAVYFMVVKVDCSNSKRGKAIVTQLITRLVIWLHHKWIFESSVVVIFSHLMVVQHKVPYCLGLSLCQIALVRCTLDIEGLIVKLGLMFIFFTVDLAGNVCVLFIFKGKRWISVENYWPVIDLQLCSSCHEI